MDVKYMNEHWLARFFIMGLFSFFSHHLFSLFSCYIYWNLQRFLKEKQFETGSYNLPASPAVQSCTVYGPSAALTSSFTLSGYIIHIIIKVEALHHVTVPSTTVSPRLSHEDPLPAAPLQL